MLRLFILLFYSGKIEERSIVIQIRLIMIVNEQIWTALDRNNHLLAAELCLFAEHIYTGKRIVFK